MSDGDHLVMVKINAAVLSVRNVQFLPTIANDLNQTIAHHNAKFPIRRVEVKTVGTGLRSKVEHHLFKDSFQKKCSFAWLTMQLSMARLP